MDQHGKWRESDIFVVRVFRTAGGDLTGVVQHVRTGEKVAFQKIEGAGEAMARMARPPGEPPGLEIHPSEARES